MKDIRQLSLLSEFLLFLLKSQPHAAMHAASLNPSRIIRPQKLLKFGFPLNLSQFLVIQLKFCFPYCIFRIYVIK